MISVNSIHAVFLVAILQYSVTLITSLVFNSTFKITEIREKGGGWRMWSRVDEKPEAGRWRGLQGPPASAALGLQPRALVLPQYRRAVRSAKSHCCGHYGTSTFSSL